MPLSIHSMSLCPACMLFFVCVWQLFYAIRGLWSHIDVIVYVQMLCDGIRLLFVLIEIDENKTWIGSEHTRISVIFFNFVHTFGFGKDREEWRGMVKCHPFQVRTCVVVSFDLLLLSSIRWFRPLHNSTLNGCD